MTTLSTDDLVRLRDSITPGSWHWRWKSDSLHVRHSAPHEFGATVLAPSYDYDTGYSANVRDANARAIALVPDLLSELIRLRGEVEAMREALILHQAWSDSEDAGPNYGALTRDTHPDGERIWRQWWDGNLDLCARAQDATRAALAPPPPTTGEKP